MSDNEGLGAWGSLVAGLGASVGVPWIYLVDSRTANFNWFLHAVFAIGFLWGIYSTIKGIVWLFGRWTGRDDGIAELRAGDWGCWGLALLIGAALILINWETTSARFASWSAETPFILLGIFVIGYLQFNLAKASDKQFEQISKRLEALEAALDRDRDR